MLHHTAASARPESGRRLRDVLLVLGPCVVVGAAVFFLSHQPHASAAVPSTSEIRSVFLADCAVCHGARGQGTAAGPSLMGVGAATIDYWVSTGRMPLPPGHRGPRIDRRPPKYPPAVEHALVAYVAKLTGGGPPIPHISTKGADVAAGGELYRLNCAACHSWDGTGGALTKREAPSLKPATPTQIAEAVRTGPEPMPRFGESALDDEQLADVVAYVEALDHPDDRGGNGLSHAGPLAEGAVGIVIGLGALLVAIRVIGTRT